MRNSLKSFIQSLRNLRQQHQEILSLKRQVNLLLACSYLSPSKVERIYQPFDFESHLTITEADIFGHNDKDLERALTNKIILQTCVHHNHKKLGNCIIKIVAGEQLTPRIISEAVKTLHKYYGKVSIEKCGVITYKLSIDSKSLINTK